MSRESTTSGRWQLGIALALTTVTLWSALPLILQHALTFTAPLNLNFMRFGGAAFVLGGLLALRGGLPQRQQFTSSVLPILGLAVVGLAGNYAFYLWGVSKISAAAAQVVIQLAPAMLAMGSILIFKERFSKLQLVGFVTLLLGLGVFFNHRWASLFAKFDEYGFGLVLIIVAAVTWVTYALAQKQLLRTFRSPQLMVLIYACAAIVFVPFADFSLFTTIVGFDWVIFAWCIINTLIAYGAFAEAMQHLEASRVSAILSLVPLGTLLAAYLAEWMWPGRFIYEPINFLSLCGAVMVVAGSLTVALSRN